MTNFTRPNGYTYSDEEQWMIEQISEAIGLSGVETLEKVEELLSGFDELSRPEMLQNLLVNAREYRRLPDGFEPDDDDESDGDEASCGNCKFEDRCPLRGVLDQLGRTFAFMILEPEAAIDMGDRCKCHEFGEIEEDGDDFDPENN